MFWHLSHLQRIAAHRILLSYSDFFAPTTTSFLLLLYFLLLYPLNRGATNSPHNGSSHIVLNETEMTPTASFSFVSQKRRIICMNHLLFYNYQIFAWWHQLTWNDLNRVRASSTTFFPSVSDFLRSVQVPSTTSCCTVSMVTSKHLTGCSRGTFMACSNAVSSVSDQSKPAYIYPSFLRANHPIPYVCYHTHKRTHIHNPAFCIYLASSKKQMQQITTLTGDLMLICP